MKLFLIQSTGFDSEYHIVRAENREHAEEVLATQQYRVHDEEIGDDGCHELNADGEPCVLWGHTDQGHTG